ncbi:MAG: hypothetical protein Q9219_006260 [cf. Caloplaca sp. 3 TL-2023]
MSEAEEPTLVEYARYYGLSTNHLEIDPLGVLPPPDESSPIDLDDESIWKQIRDMAASPQPERLTAVKEASALLAVTNAKLYENCEFEFQDLPQRHRIRDLKHELPLLRTDHEMDMLEFPRRIEPNLEDEFFPVEMVDDEQDEGFGWPSWCHQLPETFFKKVENEKLEIGKDVFAYMKEILDIRIQGDEPTFDYEMPTYRRNTLRDPITPPLLPRSPVPQLYEPSSETGHLDLVSDQPSPTQQELERVEKSLLEKDALTPARKRKSFSDDSTQIEVSDDDSVGDIYSPLKGLGNSPSPPQWKRSRLEGLKIEGPLSPPTSDQPPPWTNTKESFSEALPEVVSMLPPFLPEPEQLSHDDIDMLFAEQLAPLAAKVDQAIEQEQLQEADTISRVPVPIMDFTKPTPPWVIPPSIKPDEWQTKFLSDIKEVHLKFSYLNFDRETEKTKLPWVPFPKTLGRVEIQESIEDDGSLAKFIAEPEPLDLNTLIWKPPGLRIFDEIYESDEEELTCATFTPANDMRSLVHKRNFDLRKDRDNEDRCNKIRNGSITELGQGCMTANIDVHFDTILPQPKHLQARTQDEKGAETSAFSAMRALDQFLGVRSGVLREKPEWEDQKPPRLPTLISTDAHKLQDSRTSKVAAKSELMIPRPQFRVPDDPRYYIASTSFLSNLKLAHQVKDLYPSAVIIERDFSLYCPQPAYTVSDAVLPRTGHDSSGDEADLILSASTGLIMTSLQRIKQQSLPGQSTRSPVRQQIEKTAARYERLIVLVRRNDSLSGNDALTMAPLDGSDCEALTSLTAFLNHIPFLNENELLLVDGDTSIVAAWIVSLMIKYSSEASVTLLEEETQWEIFLRQAGMNSFAAQVVLADVKAGQGDDRREEGLRKFMSMSIEERCQRFSGLLGGRKVLGRVGKVLDAQS